jgi:polyhydroxyalkanoate synthesis regulator phasin
MEENKYLRDLVHKFSEQLEQSKKKITESPSESRLTTINSSDVVILRNRISELESRNRTLQN